MDDAPFQPEPKTAPIPAEPPLVEGPFTPEILVDGYASCSINMGIAKLSFFSVQHDPTTGQHFRKIVARLSMAIPAMAGIQEGMRNSLEEIQRQMQVNVPTPVSEATE